MSTYAELERYIIQDMAKEGESGVTAAVSNAIDIAIRHYETQPWWFLEKRDQFTTTSGTEYYDLTSDFANEINISITISNNTYPLIKRHHSLIEDWTVASTVFSGYPTDYSLSPSTNGDQQWRMYPIPNGTYTATYSYVRKLGVPSANGSNAWTLDAELLIRARAEWQLQSLRYHDLEAATVAKQVENEAYRELQRQNIERLSVGLTRKRRV